MKDRRIHVSEKDNAPRASTAMCDRGREIGRRKSRGSRRSIASGERSCKSRKNGPGMKIQGDKSKDKEGRPEWIRVIQMGQCSRGGHCTRREIKLYTLLAQL